MAKKLVLVAGNIGAGKTSITEKLGERLGWKTGYESVADNPYLPDFYADMRAWSFHLQVFFLGHRAAQHQAAADLKHSAILDRSIYEDYYIFSRALRQLGNMDERDYDSYQRIFEQVVDGLPARPADLPVGAGGGAGTAHPQPGAGDRETGISIDSSLLESFYDEWLRNFDLCPVLTIRSHDLNFVDTPRIWRS